MPLDLPSGPRGQVLAVGLAITTLLVIWLGVVSPLVAWHAAREEHLAQQHMLARHMAALAAELPKLRQAAAVAAAGSPSLAVLPGQSDAIVGAALQGMIQDMAQRSGADLSSAEMLPAEPAGAYRRIGVHVQVYAREWPILVRLLDAIERARPRMLVDDLDIHGLPQRQKNEGPSVTASFAVISFRAALAREISVQKEKGEGGAALPR